MRAPVGLQYVIQSNGSVMDYGVVGSQNLIQLDDSQDKY